MRIVRLGFARAKYSLTAAAALRPSADGPDDERLAAAHVAGGEDAVDRGHVVGGGDVAAIVEREAELLDHAVAHRAEEAHGEQDEIDVEGELGAGDGFELGRRADANGSEAA